MATGTRSSKRKSSPSLKKKRRIKDRSKKSSKIVKGKSKKVSRRKSPDSYSDNDSLSSASSVSYSSSDSDIRRSRPRTRKEPSKRTKEPTKSGGSRLRSKSVEKNSIKERRGKKSKKSKDTDAKKKRLRKKRKREPSVSSSSRSLSCSTCRSSDDSEREHQKTEKRVKRRGRSRTDLGEENRRWCDDRSRSRSPCRLDGSDDSYLIEEQHLVVNNPRRLRSIIIFAKEFEEEEEEDTELIDTDVHKEEIVYDQDDYPSPRSSDSHDDDNDGKTGYLEDEHGKNVGLVDHGKSVDSLEVCEASVPSTDAGSSVVDLETALRLKALENLRKFKGGRRANAKKPASTKSCNDGELKLSSGLNAKLELQKKDEESSVEGIGILSVPHQNMSIVGHTVDESSTLNVTASELLPILPQDSEMVNPYEKDSLGLDRLEGGESLPLPSTDVKRLTDSVDGGKDKHEAGSSCLVQCIGSNKLPIQESSMPISVSTQSKETVAILQPSHDANIVTDDTEKAATAVSSTSLASNLEGQSSNAKGKEEGDSQFQQKTMSVMRGGEMVQVSYKVYIPKHVPALARRKLKR